MRQRNAMTLVERQMIHKLITEDGFSINAAAAAVLGSEGRHKTIRDFIARVGMGIDGLLIQQEEDQKKKTTTISAKEIEEILLLEGVDDKDEVAQAYGIPASIVKKIWDREITSGIQPQKSFNFDTVVHYDRLSKRAQKQQDLLRVERKHTRERNRVNVVLEELTIELTNVIEANKISHNAIHHKKVRGGKIGVIQLSDIHFGEQIKEVAGNRFDYEVIAARLKKFADRAISTFESEGVGAVLIAMTGDLVNSDRRLDEITTNAENRAKVIFTAVDILQQFINLVNQKFNVTVASVCGNESRIGKDVGWVQPIASDSFDAIIHNILARLYAGSKGVSFIAMDDPLECVVDLNGAHFLLIHGHNGLANTTRIENEVAKIRSRYSMQGVKIDYVILGHIHSAMISDHYARSSGLPGGNAYSDKALNLTSRSSQNIYLVSSDGSVDGMKIDLQEYDLENAFAVNQETAVFKPRDRGTSTVVIQSVVI